MKGDGMNRATTIFHKALEVALEKRSNFLAEACAGDSELQAHVQELLDSAEETDSFAEAQPGDRIRFPQPNPLILAAGDVVGTRYEVIRFIGKGGMGEVYEVEDRELRTRVALKTVMIFPLLSAHLITRFKREIQLARKVTHPNVCRVYDLGHHSHPTCGDILFLTMELLQGNTLTAYLHQHGPMSLRQALPLIGQMISALSAAHQLGIVHRDFKPGNVMLIDEANQKVVKVTDFGLARSLRPEDNTTFSHAEVVGTPSYMAPEQFRGQYGPETDVYALGLTIFEMVTAKQPTSKSAPFKNVQTDKAKQIGSRWQRVITKCVATDPVERFHDVRDVWKALSGSSSANVDLAPPVFAVKRYAIAFGGFVFLLIALLVLVWNGIVPNPWHRLPEQKHIAVLPFQSISNDVADQAFSDGVVESLTSKLSQLERFQKSFWVVPSTDTRQIKSLDDAYRKLNVTLAVTGSIQHTGAGLILTSNLVDAKNHKQLASRTIRATSSDLDELQGRVWESVADMVDLQISPEAARTVNLGETKLPGAYELYEQGVGYSQRYDEDSLDHAIDLFNGALSKDPGYALAYAGLGSAYASKYALTKDPQWIKKAISNGQRALELNDRLVPVHITMGQVYRETGELDKALSEFHRALNEDPSAIDAAYLTGEIYEAQGKLSEAEGVFQTVVNRRPGYWKGYSGLGAFYYRHGEFAKAAAQFQAMIDLQPDNSMGYHDLGGVYLAMARYDDAIAILKKGLALKETSRAWNNLGSAYMYLNRYPQAVDAMKRATELDPHNDVLWRNLGDSYRQLPSGGSDATSAYEKALQAANRELSVNPNSTEVLSGVALYDAHLGRKKDAERSISTALKSSPKDSDVLFTSALVYEIIGNRNRALEAIDQAVKFGYSIEDVEHEPEFRALRSDSRYQRWLRQKKGSGITQE
jgi:serine/threonine protein kinase/regulator of sirC expression with transglutaminase-like and TPR domain